MYSSHDDWVYLAGLVDGEGSIIISTPPSSPRRMFVKLAVGMTHEGVIRWIEQTFGGNVGLECKINPLRRKLWRWTVHSGQAVEILRRLQPLLKVKQTQAWLAREAWAQRMDGHEYGRRRLPDEEIALRQGYALACSYLNHAGVA